ncbi:MAG: HPr(Ser) kinase/phosphatase [Verrucomicrobiales bacterium]|nr:HPr(Ser) kinase/phosphatase [Verrucomicrobiales bacterium]|tara:strand:+ start:12618 stop:13571 length:954 start_codon:yes stop_codon:yes gene_type:complete
MAAKQNVTVQQFFEDNAHNLDLKPISGKGKLKRVIKEPTVNRPGLALAGHTKYFAFRRVQVFGNAEISYVKTLSADERVKRYQNLFSHQMPCIVFCRNQKPDKELLKVADKKGIPVFRSSLITMKFINLATMALEVLFAPRGTEMGSMVDVHGVGTLVKGDSGIGKSECILALLERGYSLISDDVTKFVLLDNREIVGTSPDLTRNFMEVRGIGIVNAAALFGVRAIRQNKRLDLVVTLEQWEDLEDVDRLGMEENHIEILGVKIPHVVLPVRPGRDLGRLIEVAALQAKLKRTGYNPAEDLNAQLKAKMQINVKKL